MRRPSAGNACGPVLCGWLTRGGTDESYLSHSNSVVLNLVSGAGPMRTSQG